MTKITEPAPTIHSLLTGNVAITEARVNATETRKLALEAIRGRALMTTINPESTKAQLLKALQSFWRAVDCLRPNRELEDVLDTNKVKTVVSGSFEWFYSLVNASEHRNLSRSIIDHILMTVEDTDYRFIEGFRGDSGFRAETLEMLWRLQQSKKATDEQRARIQELVVALSPVIKAHEYRIYFQTTKTAPYEGLQEYTLIAETDSVRERITGFCIKHEGVLDSYGFVVDEGNASLWSPEVIEHPDYPDYPEMEVGFMEGKLGFWFNFNEAKLRETLTLESFWIDLQTQVLAAR